MNLIQRFLFLSRNIFNAIIIKRLIIGGCYQKAIERQFCHIKTLEYNNSQVLLGKAYYRLAKLFFLQEKLTQTIDNCIMAFYTYSYCKRNVYVLCARAYRIMALNCPDFESKSLWIQQILKEKELINA